MFVQLKQHSKKSFSVSLYSQVVRAEGLKIAMLAPRPWLGDRSNYEGR